MVNVAKYTLRPMDPSWEKVGVIFLEFPKVSQEVGGSFLTQKSHDLLEKGRMMNPPKQPNKFQPCFRTTKSFCVQGAFSLKRSKMKRACIRV